MTSEIAVHPLPFVFKSNQGLGGAGTVIVSTENEHKGLLDDLSPSTLPRLLSLVGFSNVHLRPATLLLSDLFSDSVGDFGLTIFLTKIGECIFVSVTEQTFSSGSKVWTGSTIFYPAQARLKQKFGAIMLEIGAWLHSHCYYGPSG